MHAARTVLVLLAVVTLVAAAAAPAVGATTADADCGFPVTRTDATGTAVTVDERPTRIATLSPSAAQTLWEVGVRERVVGVSEFASYLDGADSRTVVNTASGGIDAERLVALRPDLVFAPATIDADTVEVLRDRGLRVVALESPSTVEGVATKTTLVGRLVGACEGAAATNAWMRANVAAVERAVADEPRPAAMYVFSDGWTVGDDTFIRDVLRTAGTRNVVADEVSGYARVSAEIVRERDPAWLVYNDRDGIPNATAYRETTAVREGQTVAVDVNYLNQPGPRSIVFAVRTIATAVHPEAAADADYVPRSAVGAAGTPAATASPSTTTGSAPEPVLGLGVGAVVLVLWARREGR
jgi:iron complex transport system substrate-binding protein